MIFSWHKWNQFTSYWTEHEAMICNLLSAAYPRLRNFSLYNVSHFFGFPAIVNSSILATQIALHYNI